MENQQNEPIYRHELKYLVSSAQIAILKQRIRGLMPLDPHVSESDSYNVRSLYFDDYENQCYYDVENGADHKEKYRIRIYNRSDEHIHLELKRKDNGKTAKTACILSKEQADLLISGRYPPDISGQARLLQGLCVDMMQSRMRPVIIVEYERIPYVYRGGNVRVTFDTMIASSRAVGDFFAARIPNRPVLPAGMQLMEVKFDQFLPDTIYRGLQLGDLRQTAFSKYYLCRKYSL